MAQKERTAPVALAKSHTVRRLKLWIRRSPAKLAQKSQILWSYSTRGSRNWVRNITFKITQEGVSCKPFHKKHTCAHMHVTTHADACTPIATSLLLLSFTLLYCDLTPCHWLSFPWCICFLVLPSVWRKGSPGNWLVREWQTGRKTRLPMHRGNIFFLQTWILMPQWCSGIHTSHPKHVAFDFVISDYEHA